MFRVIRLLPFVLAAVAAQAQTGIPDGSDVQHRDEPVFTPFVERYILDELKAVRVDQQDLRAELADRLAQTRLDAADRAIGYTTDTVNNVFFIITAAASLFVLVGWNSIRDMRSRTQEIIDARVAEITVEYEDRLRSVESEMRSRSDEILAVQQEIAERNTMHSLWLRAGLESNPTTRVEIYDDILQFDPENVEALAYKADAVLERDEHEWALNLANQAISLDADYGYAYWQRACARAALGQPADAIDDIRTAIDRTPSLADQVYRESFFHSLQSLPDFESLDRRGDREEGPAD